MNILGISCFYHESAAALIVDGRVMAAAEEERFTRRKHDPGFPRYAIDVCLRAAGLGVKDLDFVVFYEKPFRKFERNLLVSLKYFPWSLSFFIDSMRNFLTEKLWIKSVIASNLSIDSSKILFVPHHLSHAATAYYTSPFERAAVLTLDGVGEWTTGTMGVARGNRMNIEREMRFPHSVGLLYAAFTAYLGFAINDGEYKVMGMAGYGKPKYKDRVKKLYRQHTDGSITLHLDYFAYQRSSRRMYSEKFVRLFEGLSPFDIAASLQRVTEDIILTMARVLHKKTKEDHLVYGGGVALNSVVNALITKNTGFKRLSIFPAAGDDGGAVGAALYVYHHVLGNKKRHPPKDMFLGEEFDDSEIRQFLNKNNILYKRMHEKHLLNFISQKLIEGKVIGWFEGRAEFGPRALGHRSILADPQYPNMKDIVNQKIKFREEFRPFAPVVLSEQVQKYFPRTDALLSRYMLGAYPAAARTKSIAGATVHIDGTSRVQTVHRGYPGRFRKLLEAFYKKTGRPILLNTSLNVKGEPIVNSPADAYRTFIGSGLDVLVLGKCVILKQPSL